MYPELSEAERFPLLTDRGRKLLYAMRQHRHAPIWNWPNGEQLNADGLARVHQFAQQLNNTDRPESLEEPTWLDEFRDDCLREVPFYRSRTRANVSFVDLPTCCRSDLAPAPWMFVPDRAPLDELIVFSSSGTSGEPTRTPHHPYSAASGVPLLEHALRTLHGITLPRGPESIAITNVAAYSGAFTTAIVVAFLQEAGCIRVNLHPSAWRSPSDPHRFLNAMPAPVWLGDPIAFGALEQLELNDAPQAIVSSIMHLHEGYARQLTSRYGCPVIDVYAMTEAGIIAARDESGHRILAPDLFVEILDARGDRCPPGVRGEIVLSGGRNPFLPLLRYRTGDYAAIELLHGDRVLTELAGREPTSFLAESGAIVHSMEIVRLMRKHPVRRYELRSIEDGYTLLINGTVDQRALEQEMRNLLGNRFKGLNVPLDSPR